jgi:hypothetical protein
VNQPDAGLCRGCAHARLQRTARGSAFWRCLRADTDARFPRYPRLPVLACPGYAPRARSGKDERR